MIKEVNKNKVCMACECGYNVCGNSDLQLKAVMKIHKKSKRHKEMLAVKQGIHSGEINLSNSKTKGGAEIVKS
jgi:hypothetical protein